MVDIYIIDGVKCGRFEYLYRRCLKFIVKPAPSLAFAWKCLELWDHKRYINCKKTTIEQFMDWIEREYPQVYEQDFEYITSSEYPNEIGEYNLDDKNGFARFVMDVWDIKNHLQSRCPIIFGKPDKHYTSLDTVRSIVTSFEYMIRYTSSPYFEGVINEPEEPYYWQLWAYDKAHDNILERK